MSYCFSAQNSPVASYLTQLKSHMLCKTLCDLLPWLSLTSCSSTLLTILWTYQTHTCLKSLAPLPTPLLFLQISARLSCLHEIPAQLSCYHEHTVQIVIPYSFVQHAHPSIFIFLHIAYHHLTCCIFVDCVSLPTRMSASWRHKISSMLGKVPDT